MHMGSNCRNLVKCHKTSSTLSAVNAGRAVLETRIKTLSYIKKYKVELTKNTNLVNTYKLIGVL